MVQVEQHEGRCRHDQSISTLNCMLKCSLMARGGWPGETRTHPASCSSYMHAVF